MYHLVQLEYDFSLGLQQYSGNRVTLGSNPWQCTCDKEITNSVCTFNCLVFLFRETVLPGDMRESEFVRVRNWQGLLHQ